eukprot:2385073-Pyramimonas_sp.AAC.1
MESCRQKGIVPKSNHTLKQLSKCLNRIRRHAPDTPHNAAWSLETFDDRDGWINLDELVREFPRHSGRTRQDGYNPRLDEAKIIAETFYDRT